jgi:hypothetical protein
VILFSFLSLRVKFFNISSEFKYFAFLEITVEYDMSHTCILDCSLQSVKKLEEAQYIVLLLGMKKYFIYCGAFVIGISKVI